MKRDAKNAAVFSLGANGKMAVHHLERENAPLIIRLALRRE